MLGPPGGGKSDLSAAIGFTQIVNGWRLFRASSALFEWLDPWRRSAISFVALSIGEAFQE
ncbi:hypothetical protein C7I85_24760 [Mesorhizobium soli]|uniref:Uncharacterized protein n=1 Tax=Pseudaminobacter soli (ex Li et al. 2025) TaxID=1295366 RepID=A0A2P7S164_9HYPH|nr:hypothetical protein C7I85_24760 [Mesorhizobium soli]